MRQHENGTKRTKACKPKPRSHVGTVAERLAHEEQMKQMIAGTPSMMVNGYQVKLGLSAIYLGHSFRCDGDTLHDIQRRAAISRVTFNQMRHIWTPKVIG
eukprot:SAG11_NODE_12321_length_709_cov_0.900000_2_plen_100_part_00